MVMGYRAKPVTCRLGAHVALMTMVVGLLAASGAASAQPVLFAPGASHEECYVPDGPSCQDLLVRAIGQARQSILVQAYEFTSPPIAHALAAAKGRGVDVRVILDKSQETQRYSGATYLANAQIPVAIDDTVSIAHNKVMIFDGQAVFTGSFNFTRSAQTRNAENGILIANDPVVSAGYIQNWNARLAKSRPYRP